MLGGPHIHMHTMPIDSVEWELEQVPEANALPQARPVPTARSLPPFLLRWVGFPPEISTTKGLGPFLFVIFLTGWAGSPN